MADRTQTERINFGKLREVIQPPNLMGALQYMNLAPGEIGDDAHQYAWVAAYRDKWAEKKAA